MGKKWDTLLGKSFNISKFKTIVNVAVYRIAFLKNRLHVRCSQARSDVVQLLTLDHHESALLRVGHVIREQNLLDAFAIIEGYCHLLVERIMLIQNSKTCPEEVKEAISSLIFAASRCGGQVPELQKIRGVFSSKFGKEFAASAVELRNNCGVHPKIVKKLPLRHPSMKSRLKLLKEIASENEIKLQLERETSGVSQKFKEPTNFDNPECKDDPQNLAKGLESDEKCTSIMKERNKYKDVTKAAEAAFQLAANAAAAAKAAMELASFKLREKEPENQRSQISPVGCSKPMSGMNQNTASKSREMKDNQYRFYRSHSQLKAEMKKSSSSSDFDECTTDGEKEIGFDEDNTTRWLDRRDFERKCSLFLDELSKTGDGNGGKDEAGLDENGDKVNNQSKKRIDLKTQPEPLVSTQSLDLTEKLHSQHSNRGRRPISVRTRRTIRF
ncbi:hypothetical protein ACSBR1_023486 [Camellia fascicularis]